MASERVSLAKCAKFIVDNRGKTCPVGDEGIPLIATNCLRSGGLYPTIETSRFVSEQVYSTWFRAHPLPGDIIFVTKGAPGRTCLAPDPVNFCIAQDMVAIRANEEIVDPLFLFAALRSPSTQIAINDLHVGTMIPHFKKSDFDKLFFDLPERRVQEKAGRLHFELCNRIELLHQTSATLEAIAQALFKSWFVDFDPVHAKAEGREPEGMDPATAALFPSEFEDSELGPIPKGWMLTEVGAVAELIKGCSYKGAGLSESEGAFMFNLGCFNAIRTFATEKIKRYTGVYRDRHVVRGGDLIMANTDMTQNRQILGRALFVPAGYDPAFISHHVFKVEVCRPRADVWRRYLFFAFQQPAFRERAVGHATGTTVLALARDSAELCPVIEPNARVLASFDGMVAPLLCKIENNLKLAATLEQLRDILLPRLISGKLRLPEAEREIEAATA